MKHLRKFNESSSPKDIKSNLEDIFIDFSDRHIPVELDIIRFVEKRFVQFD